eukprot:TRINITY_DN7819_c0_g2_i15.p1 TRINITY_DN7819_c0_g2~~TRINITY_DN7819_c0_g2_i15.p1  ORF type:complete len:321 (-),score=83.55 TRINITY_DN7819_c0_g2_i15:516-1436(-)
MAFNIFVILLGDVLYASLIGSVCISTTNANAFTSAFHRRMRALRQYLNYRRVSKEIKDRIFQYHEYLFSIQQGIDERIVLDTLPENARREVSWFLYQPLLTAIPFFQNCDHAFLSSVAALLEPQTFLPGDAIFYKGDSTNNLFFLRSGTVVISLVTSDDNATLFSQTSHNQENGAVKKITLQNEGFFGDISFFTGSRRSATVRAVDHCEVLMLPNLAYVELSKLYVEDAASVLEKFVQFSAHNYVDVRFPQEFTRNQNLSSNVHVSLRKTASMDYFVSAAVGREQVAFDRFPGQTILEEKEQRELE